MTLKAKVEAVLFMTDKPIKAAAVARIVNSDVQLVRQALLELIREYEERPGGLQITDEDGYSFQVKDEYSSLMNEFAPVEMSAALLRTLSAICIKQPVMQSEIIRVRGAGAYEHIKELVTRELIAKKDDGRSPQLTTTKKFQEYFRLTRDGNDLRSFLKKQVKAAQAAAAAAEDAASASDKQLEIPVGGPEELQLNERIYLELSPENEEPAADVSGDETNNSAADDTAAADLAPATDTPGMEWAAEETEEEAAPAHASPAAATPVHAAPAAPAAAATSTASIPQVEEVFDASPPPVASDLI